MEERLKLLCTKLQITRRRHDLIAVSVTDPREETLPDIGRVCIEDAETGQVVELDTGNIRVRQAYASSSRQRREQTAVRIRSLGVDFLECVNGENWMPQLMSFFQNRRQRSG